MARSPRSPLALVAAVVGVALVGGLGTIGPALASAGLDVPAPDPNQGQQWALATIGATKAWAVGQGEGVTIAVIDTGVDLDHPELVNRVTAGHDFVDGDDVADPGPCETSSCVKGHGTHVAGIAAAEAGNGLGVAGVAPRATIMPLRALDEDGGGTLNDVIDAVDWAVAHGADVVNLSLGPDCNSVIGAIGCTVGNNSEWQRLGDAIEDAWQAGVVTVIAAGNGALLFDADVPIDHAVVVTATDNQDHAPSYAEPAGAFRWGIAAPGGDAGQTTADTDILSTWIDDPTDDSDGLAILAGTSMATPHVAGGLAVLLGLGLSPEAAVNRVLDTAADIGPQGHDDQFGAGRLDVAAAVAGLATATTTSSTAPPPPALPPTTSPSEPRAATRSITPSPAYPADPTTTTAAPAATDSPTRPPGTDTVAARSATDGGDDLPAVAVGFAAVLVVLIGVALAVLGPVVATR